MAVISVLSHGDRFENHYQYGADRENAGKHFIKFTPFIHVPGKAVLTLSEQAAQVAAVYKSGAAVAAAVGNAFNSQQNNLEQGNRVVTRSPMKKSKGSVKLFLPAQISVSQKVNYAEAEMGGMLAAVMGAVSNYSGTGGLGGLDALGKIFTDVTEGAAKTAGTSLADAAIRTGAKAAEGMGVTGATAYHNIKSGISFNNRSEMMFEGIDRRSFAFTFRLIPHSAREAAEIQNIVTSFRYYMLPEIPQGLEFGRALKPPSTYMISYSHQDTLHKIGECFLESVDVKYGGERPQFYNDNRPTETELTLQFKEMDIMTKRKVLEGF